MLYTTNLSLRKPEESDGSSIIDDLNANWEILDALVSSANMYTMHWQDLRAADADYIHAAITGTGASNAVTTNITNPDVPRVVSFTCTNNASPSGNVTLVGTVRGSSVTEEVALVPGGTAYSSYPYETITSITIPATVGASDNVTVGIGDKLGLIIIPSAESKVFKAKRGQTHMDITGLVNTTYGTLDCSTIEEYEDITVFMRGD